MLHQGIIWQKIRQCALDTVPEGCRVSYASPPTLDTWLKKGAYSVATASKDKLILHASHIDIGAALLTDASFYADHVIEHSAFLRNHLSCGRWNSSAWLAITTYYWSFFSVLAFTRIIGRTIWFVDQDRAKFLKGLAGKGTNGLGAGVYRLTCGKMLSSGYREIELKKSNQTRLHEAIWYLWYDMLREWVDPVNAAKSPSPELAPYHAIVKAANILGKAWPSDLRNLLNYRPGIGYGTVRKNTPSAIFSKVATDPAGKIDKIISQLETHVAGLQKGESLNDQIAFATVILFNMTIITDILINLLIEDVSDRRSIDPRWLEARLSFAREQSRTFKTPEWPAISNNPPISTTLT